MEDKLTGGSAATAAQEDAVCRTATLKAVVFNRKSNGYICRAMLFCLTPPSSCKIEKQNRKDNKHLSQCAGRMHSALLRFYFRPLISSTNTNYQSRRKTLTKQLLSEKLQRQVDLLQAGADSAARRPLLSLFCH